MMRIDCYGERTMSEICLVRPPKTPTGEKFVGGFTFYRYGEGERCVIHRIGVLPSGLVEAKWTFGAWSEADSLDYTKGIDETLCAVGGLRRSHRAVD